MNTPDKITRLNPNEIFVFGSNEAGRHGKGAAKTAMNFGAKYGLSFGLSGQSFAIPTKDKDLKVLSINSIKNYVDSFIEFAENNPNLIFLVTKIGCGLSNYKTEDIAPLFSKALNVDNIILPVEFEN